MRSPHLRGVTWPCTSPNSLLRSLAYGVASMKATKARKRTASASITYASIITAHDSSYGSTIELRPPSTMPALLLFRDGSAANSAAHSLLCNQ
ncbi:hypothetical protein MTO96_047936 [Rhipicephalus appendiculatus]